ncbi:scopoletin glucosyltransferase-like [Ananas comosus]|uniref:Scopoletin glucosyltransferase-like n=1 Tax=Ananas comosus TaxID=4615 RepID=A0A6P5EYZ8_ANACO|nr:scopoletin glucosyltransferase-like [Ananas comosus]
MPPKSKTISTLLTQIITHSHCKSEAPLLLTPIAIMHSTHTREREREREIHTTVTMESSDYLARRPLHVVFFPFMATGHMPPMVDMANLFAARGGVATTVVATPANAPLIDSRRLPGANISLRILPFPSPALTGLPPGIENIAELSDSDSVNRFMVAVPGLREPFSRLLREIRPVDAVVSDYFFPWTIPVAEELGIPRLVFHGTGFFALCATAAPATPLGSSDTVVLGGLPRRVVMLRSQMPDSGKSPPAFRELFGEIATTEGRSFGTVVNSFYELEPDYIRHFREAMGHRAWHVGPIALFGRDGTLLQRRLRPKEKQEDEEAQERKEQTHEPTGSSSYLIEWLDRNRPGSVIYVCFGSMGRLGAAQLAQLAFGLEASDYPFIWVVRDSDDDDAEWLRRGFRERVEDRGLVLKGWSLRH